MEATGKLFFSLKERMYMNIVAYCRVSTDKQDQLNSLETQKSFFKEYTEKKGYNLVEVYADEGISGTTIKNRKEFQRLMKDAERGIFDMVISKDISRFARNTVDLLKCVRKLKELGIKVIFLTADMTSHGDSEFILTIFGALAQEESSNISKRIKFGKKINAEKGRVPNIVYGYDKTIGNYYDLKINQEEAEIIKQIYKWYNDEGYGASRIASMLNENGYRTKRNCLWSQNAICRILTNELYIGKIINGKQEVKDFLTGVRVTKDKDKWIIKECKDLQIISLEQFEKAKSIMDSRHDSFKLKHERQSNKYLFSTIIKCKECGWSFRRTVRTYKNTYIRWVCSERNGKGINSCPNCTVVDEQELKNNIEEYLKSIISNKKGFKEYIVKEFVKQYKSMDTNQRNEKQLNAELTKLRNVKKKNIEMYEDDIITREELNNKVKKLEEEINKKETELKMITNNITKSEQLEMIINQTFKSIDDIVSVEEMTNAQLKRIIDRIEVDKEGNIDIYFKLLSDIGLEKSIPISDNCT